MHTRCVGQGNGSAIGSRIELNSFVEYDNERKEFVLPVVFPANWNGEIELGGFRSQEGFAAQPVKLHYSTGNAVFDQADLQRLQPPDTLAKLRDVMDNVRRSRKQIRSLSETVRTVRSGGRRGGAGFSRLYGNASHFKMQGERQFFGDVSQVMGVPFQIGSDGEECWFFSHRSDDNGQLKPTLITCKYEDIQHKSLVFLDPFHLDGEIDPVIHDQRLQYVGVDRIHDTDCHLIRSWNAKAFGSRGRILLRVAEWWIDTKTARPKRIVTYSSGVRTVTVYRHDSINKQLKVDEFQPVVPPGVQRERDSLGDGYDSRFISISDGTNATMSCRWGKTGIKGKSSSGLN